MQIRVLSCKRVCFTPRRKYMVKAVPRRRVCWSVVNNVESSRAALSMSSRSFAAKSTPGTKTNFKVLKLSFDKIRYRI